MIFSFLNQKENLTHEDLTHIDRREFLKLGAVTGMLTLIPGTAVSAILKKIKHDQAKTTKSQSKALRFFNTHTGEKMDVAYFTKGRYSTTALKDINHLFRDYRTGTVKKIDPRLLDYLYGISLKLETRSTPFHIISGYRTPETNAMLCNESSNVARHSLHIQGKAVDIRLPGRSIASLRRAAVALKKGGVGYYPSENFVHVDVGDVRYW